MACTGAGVGAALCGYRPIVTHPRVDFALLATDQMVNQAAKWNSMFGGNSPVPVVFRMIVNRGGEQGAQHSQSLYSWFAHIPGLRVVVPSTPQDAQDLLIAATLCDDPVVYIDDRWLYEIDDEVTEPKSVDLSTQGPKVLREGKDITLVGLSWTTKLLMDAAQRLEGEGISCEVVDLRVLNPLDASAIIKSVAKTTKLLVTEGDWISYGIGSEVITRVIENLGPKVLSAAPRRHGLADAPAPTSKPLEGIYYPHVDDVIKSIKKMMETSQK